MEVSYHSSDFSWDKLKEEIEGQLAGLDDVPENPSTATALLQQMPGVRGSTVDRSGQAWEEFHTSHATGRFFKERRYLLAEFPELLTAQTVLEVGCGTGSTAVAILRHNEKATVLACDVSNAAIALTRAVVDAKLPQKDSVRLRTFAWDPTLDEPPDWLSRADEGLKAVTMIFVLSAVHPIDMPAFIGRLHKLLPVGARVFFRDYGLYDMTMLRFSKDQRLGPRLYRRGDGTLSYFFSKEVLAELFAAAEFVVEELEYCCVELVNRRKGQPMKRVWIHAKLLKS